VGILVDSDFANFNNRSVALGCFCASQNCMDTRNHFIKAEWFGHVVIATDGQPGYSVCLFVSGRKEKHRNVDALGTNCLGHAKAVHVWQHHVEQNDVGGRLLGGLHRIVAVAYSGNAETSETKLTAEKIADARFVIDD